MVWLDASKTSMIDKESNPKLAFLWESGELKGNLLKLPSGFKGEMRSDGDILHAVVIVGEPNYKMPNTGEIKVLNPGSYFNSKGKSIHQLSSKKGMESLIYIRTNGEFNIVQTQK